MTKLKNRQKIIRIYIQNDPYQPTWFLTTAGDLPWESKIQVSFSLFCLIFHFRRHFTRTFKDHRGRMEKIEWRRKKCKFFSQILAVNFFIRNGEKKLSNKNGELSKNSRRLKLKNRKICKLFWTLFLYFFSYRAILGQNDKKLTKIYFYADLLKHL